MWFANRGPEKAMKDHFDLDTKSIWYVFGGGSLTIPFFSYALKFHLFYVKLNKIGM